MLVISDYQCAVNAFSTILWDLSINPQSRRPDLGTQKRRNSVPGCLLPPLRTELSSGVSTFSTWAEPSSGGCFLLPGRNSVPGCLLSPPRGRNSVPGHPLSQPGRNSVPGCCFFNQGRNSVPGIRFLLPCGTQFRS